MARSIVVGLAVVVMAALRFTHLGILWVEEAYPMAAAQQLLRGRVLYRDLWFDKPPAFAWVYALWGAESELALRLFGFAFVLIASAAAAWSARRVWGRGEAAAALWTAFFFTFDFQATAVALTPDLLTVPFHFAALAFAATGHPFAAGLCTGVALLFNGKALLFAGAALLFLTPGQWPRLASGLLVPHTAFAAGAIAQGAWEAYWQQVWAWGAMYSRDTFVPNPVLEGARRTLNWAGFHAALLLAAWLGWRGEERRWRWGAVVVIGLAAAWLGWRFFPRYYFHALPPLVLLAAAFRGWRRTKWLWVCAPLLAVPLLRFAPRYLPSQLDGWRDTAMSRDSREAATLLARMQSPGSSLLVWGYRPELYVLTRMPAATRFLDSQPISGVLADRHLNSSHVSYPELRRQHRKEVLSGPMPMFIADGLGPYNPSLAVFHPAQLGVWQAAYRPCGNTTGFALYCRRD
jgi:hypothetical protein